MLVSLAGVMVSSCARLETTAVAPGRPSGHYAIEGDMPGVRAFVYGQRTVLAFDAPPAFLSVWDDRGRAVEYETFGRHVRLARKLDKFTLWANGRAAGPANPKIAGGRGAAARQYRVNHGVDADKITMSLQLDGNLIASSRTADGRALNRRVGIEIVHARIAHLHERPTGLASHGR